MNRFSKKWVILLLILFLQTLLCNSTLYAQCGNPKKVPKEFVENRLSGDDNYYGHPYTMFNKKYDNFNLVGEIESIRTQIRSERYLQKRPVLDAYIMILNQANKPYSTIISLKDNYSKLAEWAKYNAFVVLIAVNDTGGPINTEPYLNKMYQAFENMDYEGGNDIENVIEFANSAMCWIQAYDLYKTYRWYTDIDNDLPHDFDRNEGDCSIRNKLRTMSFNLYKKGWGELTGWGTVNHPTGWKKNHGIIAASTMLTCAIVLNDAGVRDLKRRWDPRHWFEKANDGLENCFFMGTHVPLIRDVPNTSLDGKAGFNEGPGYWNYTMQTFGPAMIASKNMKNSNWFDDPRIDNIHEWFDQIGLEGGYIPTYDDSKIESTNIQALAGSQYDYGHTRGLAFLLPDYIVSVCQARVHGPAKTTRKPEVFTHIPESGNIILRTEGKGSKHYFQMLYEQGDAISKQAWNSIPVYGEEETHEHEDFGSFVLAVNNQWLAIDPPYMKSGVSEYINQSKHHNIAMAYRTDDANVFAKEGIVTETRPNGFTLKTDVEDIPDIVSLNSADIYRSVDVYNTNGVIYYFLNDKLTNVNAHFFGHPLIEGLSVNINGNGSNQNGESSFVQTDAASSLTSVGGGRIFKWDHPCGPSRTNPSWGLIAHTAALLQPNAAEFISYNNVDQTVHGSCDGLITNKLAVKVVGKDSFGTHNRFIIKQAATETKFQTLLLPYPCNGFSYPVISRVETATSTSTLLAFYAPIDTTVTIPGKPKPNPVYVDDTLKNLHTTQMGADSILVTNPFNITASTAVLESDAEDLFMSRGEFVYERPGACSPSIIALKQAQIQKGTFLEYDDTVYISSTGVANINYKHVDKFSYSGYVSSAGGTDVTFFLPDLEPYFVMSGFNGPVTTLPTTHNASSPTEYKYVTITFPAGTTHFTIQLLDGCLGDCYFPPTANTIDSLFEFDVNLRKPLDHDLEIVQGNGHLRITNMSRMNICPDNVLVNQDSITMYMPCGPENMWLINEDGTRVALAPDTLKYICDRKLLLADRAVNETRNTIIVNNKAALVLDSGSVTHIGNGSTILIRPGGTLLVKSGATVIIGDSACVNNQGELLADDGSFVCIEEGANMLFYNDIDSFNFYYTDTADRHIVYIAMPDSNGIGGAYAGKNPSGGRGKFTGGDGIWAGGTCVPFCYLVDTNPPYGVNNRPFGWFNIGLPRALYFSEDTLCIGRSFFIDATSSLNETGYAISVCKYDTVYQTCSTAVMGITETGDFCLGKRYLFTPNEAGYYKVQLIVENDCHLTDTFFKIVYVPYLPVAVFSATDSICPGIGVLHANGVLSTSNITKCAHRWTVEPYLDDIADTSFLDDADLVNQDWYIDSLTSVSSDFTFPGYTFIGGMRYLVSLRVKGWCSDSVFSQIVSVPLKVEINLEHATSYENPIGPAPIRLIGTVLGATSWSWSPTDYLDSVLSLTPVATPPEPITYVLTGTLNGCSLTDTVVIQYNQMTNAGEDRAVCQDALTVLGSDFNAAIFLGTLDYIGREEFRSTYHYYLTDVAVPFHQYFTTYLVKAHKRVYANYDLLTNFSNETAFRKKVFAKEWFKNYYKMFVEGEARISVLNIFTDSIEADEELQGLLSLRWESAAFGHLLSDYAEYFNNEWQHHTQIVWEQYDFTNGIWNAAPEPSADYMNIYVEPDSTQKWRMTLIDDDLGLVEYDEVLLSVDSIVIPSFDGFFFGDSTIYFMNETMPMSAYYSYLWVFGDGDSSTLQNPIHTFAAFDSAYRVCLSITNSCGTYQYCDTILIDSMGLINNGFNKTDLSQEPVLPGKIGDKKQRIDLNDGETILENIPNPFNDETIISYTFHSNFTKANLRIIDVLGRTIREVPLHSSRGKVTFDVGSQSGGIYYVSLIADGVIIKSKTMLVNQ